MLCCGGVMACRLADVLVLRCGDADPACPPAMWLSPLMQPSGLRVSHPSLCMRWCLLLCSPGAAVVPQPCGVLLSRRGAPRHLHAARYGPEGPPDFRPRGAFPFPLPLSPCLRPPLRRLAPSGVAVHSCRACAGVHRTARIPPPRRRLPLALRPRPAVPLCPRPATRCTLAT